MKNYFIKLLVVFCVLGLSLQGGCPLGLDKIFSEEYQSQFLRNKNKMKNIQHCQKNQIFASGKCRENDLSRLENIHIQDD